MKSKMIALALSCALALGLTPLASGSAIAAATPVAASAAATPSWAQNAVIYEVNVRDFTAEGTFKSFANSLPRLRAMGVNVLWFMPIYPIGQTNRKGTMGSPYSVANYTAVNPDLGTSADFKNLVTLAHSNGFKVILDWVANHSAFDNPWASAHKDWYNQDSNGNIIWPAGTDWNDVADLNYDKPAMRTAMINAMKSWITDYGVDGFRCDAAGMVPTDFWNQAATALRAIDPKNPPFMLAETQDVPDLLDSAFVADYGWHLKDILYAFGNGSGLKGDFNMNQLGNLSSYPKGTYPMVFITNHDENSWTGSLSKMYGGGVHALAALTFTVPGMPLIYDGQEVGSNKQLQFFEKDLIDWNLNSATAKSNIAFYTRLISLKHKNPALFNGAAGGPFAMAKNDSTKVLSFSRTKGTNRVYALINASNLSQTTTVQWGKDGKSYYRLTDGKRVVMGGTVKYTLKPWQYQVWSTVAP